MITADECKEICAQALRAAREELVAELMSNILHLSCNVPGIIAQIPSRLAYLETIGFQIMATDFNAIIELGKCPAGPEGFVESHNRNLEILVSHIKEFKNEL